MSDMAVGSFVVHRNLPGLGIGKVLCRSYQYLLVGFVDGAGGRALKRLANDFVEPVSPPADPSAYQDWIVETTGDCHPVVAKTKVRPVAEWSLEDARGRFLARYPGGFSSEKYQRSERDWKWKKHELWHQLLPGDTLRQLARSDPHGAGARVMKVVQTDVVPLLARKGEIPVLNWALRQGDPTQFLLALADVIDPPVPDRERFDALRDALERLPTRDPGSRILTWPVLTVVPFLAQPDHHVFIKPKPTKLAAQRLGVDLLYNSHPSWEGYERVLAWGRELIDFLRPQGAKDMIDAQSFIYTIGAPTP